MKKQDNEQLCALAQKGDTEARDLLLKNNLGFIRKTANEIYLKSNLAESDLNTETSDLEQEGCLGLLTAIPLFDSSKGIKFLTYAAPFIRNAMTDLIRDVFSQYEQKMTSTTDGLALQKIRLDEILPGEERLLRIEAIADPTVKSPEQIYVDKETMRELYEGLDRLSEREQAYLLYRYAFTDDVEHTMSAQQFISICGRAAQRRWKIPRWTTSGWSYRGGFSVSLRRDESLYIPLLPSPASRILLFKNPAFVSPWCHKIRLSYCRRKVSVNRYLPVQQMAKPTPFPRRPEAKV